MAHATALDSSVVASMTALKSKWSLFKAPGVTCAMRAKAELPPLSPVEVKVDLSAQSQYDLHPARDNTPWSAVKFLVGNNCSVNQYIGRKEGAIPSTDALVIDLIWR
ncbi:hypothetical protein PPTG_24305 [Phytophthora nicotianae INRA-310]|uniref:Uncharacterized protein n=1 Tax=Phytophthora nicotianae (strain INRA-310) TaxID=761204 RepID=W2PJJ3_PHYN3|nr:hypothetical protein PPTG_24305 [Phytophthora nicotianae INRA-310]ETN00200.1 hypothetical protein PPTG_24305 [Phytophthora nicotianae INRA-310]